MPQFWRDLVDSLVRPPVARYTEEHLEDRVLNSKKLVYVREDFKLFCEENNSLLPVSRWVPVDNHFSNDKDATKIPVVLICHGNASCRLEALGSIDLYMSLGFCIYGFDFNGCGQSRRAPTLEEQNCVTLGATEIHDIATVVKHIRSDTRLGSVVLHARSMGSVAALRYCLLLDSNIACMICDSPFARLDRLCIDIVKNSVPKCPTVLIRSILRLLNRSIRKRTDNTMNIYDLDQESILPTLSVPVLFIHAQHDSLIPHQHCVDLHDLVPDHLKTHCKMISLPVGDHNSERPPFVDIEISEFLNKHIGFDHYSDFMDITPDQKARIFEEHERMY
ncbi:hypothetical protein PCE1_001706 [Barthelona sp. PCE]